MLTEYEKQLVTENHNLIYSFADKHKLDLEEYYSKKGNLFSGEQNLSMRLLYIFLDLFQ